MWLVQALLGTLGISCMYVIFKKVTAAGIPSAVLLLYLFTFGAVFYLVHVLSTKTSYAISPKMLPLIIAAAAFSYLGNYFQTSSLGNAPNPGYTLGIGALQVVIVTLVSVVLFGSELNAVKVSGISMVIVGAIVIGL